jgi:hypothetical protein
MEVLLAPSCPSVKGRHEVSLGQHSQGLGYRLSLIRLFLNEFYVRFRSKGPQMSQGRTYIAAWLVKTA